jgi:fructosamine-3-kinase
VRGCYPVASIDRKPTKTDFTVDASALPLGVVNYCLAEGLGSPTDVQLLNGGEISDTARVILRSGHSLVLKQSSRAPADLYQLESLGLDELRRVGALRIPEVHLVGETFLLMEDLGSVPRSTGDWEEFGRAVAKQHETTGPAFGYGYDNYLGLVIQRNGWTDDGHDFFIQHRVLRYLEVANCVAAFTADDRRDIESFAESLRERIPVQTPALLHGDLWRENMLFHPDAGPAAIDPAVYYGWPEAELAMVRQCGGVPDTFFAAYHEVVGSEPGWEERLELLAVREMLSAVAHDGPASTAVRDIRALVAKFR